MEVIRFGLWLISHSFFLMNILFWFMNNIGAFLFQAIWRGICSLQFHVVESTVRKHLKILHIIYCDNKSYSIFPDLFLLGKLPILSETHTSVCPKHINPRIFWILLNLVSFWRNASICWTIVLLNSLKNSSLWKLCRLFPIALTLSGVCTCALWALISLILNLSFQT